MKKAAASSVKQWDLGKPHSAKHILIILQAIDQRSHGRQDYLDNICQGMLTLIGEGVASITRYNDETTQVVARFPQPEDTPLETLDSHGLLSTYVVKSQSVLKIEDTSQAMQYGIPPRGVCSYLGTPLRLPSGEIIGTLCYFNHNKRAYTEAEEQTAELFAGRAAMTLDNMRMHQQLTTYSDSLEQLVQKRSQALLHSRDEQAHQEKLAAVGDFAQQFIYEIRSPLAAIASSLASLQKTPRNASMQHVEIALKQVSGLEDMFDEVLLYAKPTAVKTDSIMLGRFCKDFVSTYGAITTVRQQRVDCHCSNDTMVIADREKLTQVMLNLLRNASEAADDDALISINVNQATTDAVIEMHNFGDIIPPDKLPHMTNAFVSSKPSHFGLGLAIADALLQAQGGTMTLQSNLHDGTTVTVTLPRGML